MEDQLGDRMKSQYEDRTRFLLPRRTYTILRLDGKAFHTTLVVWRSHLTVLCLRILMPQSLAMLSELQGAVFAYTQSDEISVLLTDFAKPSTSAWFDGNLQKNGFRCRQHHDCGIQPQSLCPLDLG